MIDRASHTIPYGFAILRQGKCMFEEQDLSNLPVFESLSRGCFWPEHHHQGAFFFLVNSVSRYQLPNPYLVTPEYCVLSGVLGDLAALRGPVFEARGEDNVVTFPSTPRRRSNCCLAHSKNTQQCSHTSTDLVPDLHEEVRICTYNRPDRTEILTRIANSEPTVSSPCPNTIATAI